MSFSRSNKKKKKKRGRIEEEQQRQSQEEEVVWRLEEGQLNQDIEEEELEEEDTIQPIDDELGSPQEPPLTGGHLPFVEMGTHLHSLTESWMCVV